MLDGLIQSVHRRNEPLLLLRLVDLTGASWNQLDRWLRQVVSLSGVHGTGSNLSPFDHI